MKKSIIASLAVLASAAVVATFALGGAGKFGDVQVHADPVEHSVTFNASGESKATIETFDDNIAICTTTAAGNKVGVVGHFTDFEYLYFGEAHFMELQLHDMSCALMNAGAIAFGHMTGFTVVFDGPLMLEWHDENDEIHDEYLESGERFDVTCTPYDLPMLSGYETTITSLTIWYSC